MMTGLRRLFLYILLPVLVASTLQAETIDLQLNGLEIGVDQDRGTIVYLGHAATGALLEAPAIEAGLIDLAYPTDTFAPLRLAARHSEARVNVSEGELKIVYKRLSPSRGVEMPEGEVSASVTIKAAPDDCSVIFACEVDNQSKAPVPQVLFPDLMGLLPVAGQEHTMLRMSNEVVHPFREPIYSPDKSPFFVISGGWKEYRPDGDNETGGLYGINSLRWLDYGGYGGGLSVFQKAWGGWDAPIVRTRRLESDPGRLRLVWDHKARIESGKSWKSGEFWLTPHEGGWAKGIEPYRNYVRQMVPARRLPPSVRDGLGFRTIWMIPSTETDPERAFFKYSDIPAVARECIEHGLLELSLWGWCNYCELPIPTRSELGTEQDFLQAVRQARALGVNVAPFLSITLLKNRFAPIYGAEPNPSDWTLHAELIPQFRPFYTKISDGFIINTSNRKWQRDVDKEMKNWMDKGITSFGWDVFELDRHQPDLVSLISTLRPLASAKDSNATFSGESFRFERDVQVLDYSWNWVDYRDFGPVTNALPAFRANCNVEASPKVVKQGFASNLFLSVIPKRSDQPNATAMIVEKPAMSKALKQCAALRRQFLPYFTDGTYLGQSVLCAPSNGFVRAHQLDGRLLVIVLNETDASRRIDLQSRLDWWIPAKGRKYALKMYDDEGRLVKQSEIYGNLWHCTTPEMAPLGMTLFEIEAL